MRRLARAALFQDKRIVSGKRTRTGKPVRVRERIVDHPWAVVRGKAD
jgi:hypothetical protein